MLLFFLFLFCTEACFAQRISQRRLRKHRTKVYVSSQKGTVILSLDTIFNKGNPYALLVKIKEMPYHRYVLYSLHRNELATIRSRGGSNPNDNGYYSFHFTASGKVAEPEKYITFKLEKEIVAYNLVDGERINPFGEIKFLKKYPRKFSDPNYVQYIEDTPQAAAPNIYTLVNRNRDKKIYASEGSIHQDYKLIGRYKISEGITRFYLPGGLMVAEASEDESQPGSWQIKSMRDNKQHALQAKGGKVLADLIEELVKNEYL